MKLFVPVFLLFFLSGQAQEYIISAPVQEEWSENSEIAEYFQFFKVVKLDRDEILAQWPESDEVNWKMNVSYFPQTKLNLTSEIQLISSLEFNRPIKLIQGHTQNGYGVTGFLSEYTFQLTIGLHKEKWTIEPLNRFIPTASSDLYISYYTSDFIDGPDKTCATKEAEIKGDELEGSLDKRVDECKIAEIAIANDFSMFQKYGSVAGVEDHNIAVMNDLQYNYRHEFDDNVEFKIVTQFIPTTQADDPFTSSTDVDVLLPDFRSWGNGGGFGTTYDVASLWSNRDFDGSTVGYAYIGVVCNFSRYNILQDYTTSSERRRVLQAHELGHNFGYGHDGSGTDFIMAPSVTVTNNWSSSSINSISNHVASRSCLASCSTEGSPAPDFVTKSGSSSCAPATIEFKDFSEYGATRTWTLPGSDLGTTTTQQPDATYDTEGDYDVTVFSTNNAGNDSRTFIDAISVQSEPDTPCDPSGSPSGGGITRFTLANVTNNSSGSSAGRLEDFRCENTIELEPSTTYDITVGLGNCNASPQIFERFQLYIDYDNNGVFAASERVSQTNSFWCGTISSGNDGGLQFTTPASIAEDVLYLIRAVVDNSTPGSCPSLTTGQVEDYSGTTQSQLLPVEILDFSVRREQSIVVLNWSTSSEINNDGWEIERSLDAENFEQIDYMSGAVNSTIVQNYNYQDKTPFTAKSYYRLKQKDLDGSVTYSPILNVPAIEVSYGDLTVYPNPVNHEFSITHLGQLEDLSSIVVLNSLGQIVQNYQIDGDVDPINQTFQWNTDLSPGIYQLIGTQVNSRTFISNIVVNE